MRRSRVTGPGTEFVPHVTVSDLPWFTLLLSEQNNFSLGLNMIRDQGVIDALVTYDQKGLGFDIATVVETGTRESSFTARRGQSRFSNNVRANYRHQCCFPSCTVADPEFLVGAHIARWADVEELRGDVSNGLCLCLMHDRAFELGLFTLDNELRVITAEQDESQPSWATGQIQPYAGEPIKPCEFPPSVSALQFHREKHRDGFRSASSAFPTHIPSEIIRKQNQGVDQ